jgi:hypothetical protein
LVFFSATLAGLTCLVTVLTGDLEIDAFFVGDLESDLFATSATGFVVILAVGTDSDFLIGVAAAILASIFLSATTFFAKALASRFFKGFSVGFAC